MRQKNYILKGGCEILMDFLIYYFVNQLIQVTGIAYLEQYREYLSFSVLGTEVFLLLRGFVLLAAFLFAGLAVFPYYQKEKVYLENTSSFKKEYLVIPAAGGAAALFLNYLWSLNPYFMENTAYRSVAEQQYSYPLWLGLMIYGMAAPIAEEIMFRGIMYNILRRSMGIKQAIVISSFLFGMFHGNIVQAAYGMVMGTIMAYIYEKYHSLKVPVLFHSGANVTVYFLQKVFE